MSAETVGETTPEPQGKRLTLLRATLIFVGQLFYIFLMSWVGLETFFHGSKIAAIPCCSAALLSIFALPASWKRYRLVKAGAVVLLPPKVASPPVPSVIAVFAVSVWTLLVLIAVAGSAVGLLRAPMSFNVGAIIIGVNLSLWYITGYLWYRVQKGWRKRPSVQPGYKQQEGVWPPAPVISKEDAQAYRESYTYQRLTNHVTRGTLTYRTNIRRNARKNLTRP